MLREVDRGVSSWRRQQRLGTDDTGRIQDVCICSHTYTHAHNPLHLYLYDAAAVCPDLQALRHIHPQRHITVNLCEAGRRAAGKREQEQEQQEYQSAKQAQSEPSRHTVMC